MTTVVVTDPEYRNAVDIFKNADGFDCIPAPPDEDYLADAIRKADARLWIMERPREQSSACICTGL
jgi:hypothetical protein